MGRDLWANKTALIRLKGRVTGETYVRDILREQVQPFVREDIIFMHDNDPFHCSRAQDFLEEAGIFVMSWPSVSPDLNPIENVWTLLKSGLREKTGGNEELLNVLVEIWDSKDIVPVILSMRKRLLQVIDADGGHTKY